MEKHAVQEDKRGLTISEGVSYLLLTIDGLESILI